MFFLPRSNGLLNDLLFLSDAGPKMVALGVTAGEVKTDVKDEPREIKSETKPLVAVGQVGHFICMTISNPNKDTFFFVNINCPIFQPSTSQGQSNPHSMLKFGRSFWS